MLEFNVNIIQIINIGAIINGLIFCFLLLIKKENKGANRFLALLILSLAFTLITGLILQFNLYDAYPGLHWLPFTMTFWIGPALYFYIRHLIDADFKFNYHHLWHFSLIILNYLHSFYHLIYGRNFPYPLLHNFTEAIGTYALISIFIYLIISYKGVSKYQKAILHQLSTTDHLQLNWIKHIIRIVSLAFALIAIVRLVDYKELIDYSVDSYEGYLFPYRDFLQFILAFTIYWLSFGGYKQLQTTTKSEPIGKIVDDKDYSAVIAKLFKTMNEDRLFLDPALNLKMLCEETRLSSKEISVALNQHLNKNFYSFVNEYRVEEAKKRLCDPKYQHLKILSIAYDCGFNSKATFNRIFKEITGKPPKDFRINA